MCNAIKPFNLLRCALRLPTHHRTFGVEELHGINANFDSLLD
jgi:hypothetical protein